MTGWQEFEGQVEPLLWGRATYTILRLPTPVAMALRAAGARRVEGEINEHPVNLALSRAPVVEGDFLWAGQTLLDRLGAAPGERLDIRLRPAPDDLVETPPDVEAALVRAGYQDSWNALTPGKRRGLLYKVGTARTDATRRKRIDALVESLGP